MVLNETSIIRKWFSEYKDYMFDIPVSLWCASQNNPEKPQFVPESSSKMGVLLW